MPSQRSVRQSPRIKTFGRVEPLKTSRHLISGSRIPHEGRESQVVPFFCYAGFERKLGFVALVRSGYAWWYRKYAGTNEDLADAERGARGENRGLWQDASPVPPWDWRDGEREGSPVIDDEPSDYTHWIKNGSERRHRKGCRYFGKGDGRPCKEDEGEPCKVCGG